MKLCDLRAVMLADLRAKNPSQIVGNYAQLWHSNQLIGAD